VSRTGGFKEERGLGIQQELPNNQKTAGSAWTPLPAHVERIKPPEIAGALCNVLASFGGGSSGLATHEHDGGHDDE